jgi:RimJ/RimL family protein N-acetyltransferase
MRHDIQLAGHAFWLRPIELGDADLIVSLRSDRERTRYMHEVPLNVEAQATYLRRYFERPGDYYFVIERLGSTDQPAEGLVGIYNVDSEPRRAEWGRWILRPRSLGAVESAWLVYRVGFERLDLDQMYCHTLMENASALSFHDRAGLVRTRILPGFIELGGTRHDAVEHVLDRAAWPEVSGRLDSDAKRVAERLLSVR